MEDTLQVFDLRGIDQRHAPSPGWAAEITDMLWDRRGAWVDGPGFRTIMSSYEEEQGEQTVTVNAFDSTGEVTSLHWFAQGNGATQWLLWETADGELNYLNGSVSPTSTAIANVVDELGNAFDGSTRSRTYVRAPNHRTQSVVYGRNLYLVNGYDQPLVFNGRYAERAGFDMPAAPPDPIHLYRDVSSANFYVFEDGTLGLGSQDKKCGYRYRCTFVNERGQESPMSAASESVVFTNAAGKRGCVRLRVPKGGSNVVARRLYRTRDVLDDDGYALALGREEDYYFLVEIQDNITETFEDKVADSGLGSLADPLDFGAWPGGTKMLAVFKGTMFAAGDTDNLVRFSRALNPEVFPPDNVLPVGGHGDGPVTGMLATRNALVVFRQRSTWLVKGDPNSGFYSQPLDASVGCAAARSVKEVPGLGAVFVSESGVYLLEGALENTGTPTRMVPLSEPLTALWRKVNTSALPNACAAVWSKHRCYVLALPTIGAADNDLVLLFHYEIGAWSTAEGFPIGCMLETKDHRGYLLFGSHDDSNAPGIHHIGRGWDDKGGLTSVSPVYESAPLRVGSNHLSALPHRVRPVIMGRSTDLTVNVRMNRYHDLSITTSSQEDETAGRSGAMRDRRQEDPMPVFGTAVLDSSVYWHDERMLTIELDIDVQHETHAQEIGFRFTVAGRRIDLHGYEMDVAAGQGRRHRPITGQRGIGSGG